MPKYRRIMKGISVLVIRWNGSEYRYSKPCKYCSEYMKILGIKKIHYSLDDGSIESHKMKNFTSEHLSISQRGAQKT